MRQTRWARLGAWERLLDLVQQRGIALGMVFLDGTCGAFGHEKPVGLGGPDVAQSLGRDVRHEPGEDRKDAVEKVFRDLRPL